MICDSDTRFKRIYFKINLRIKAQNILVVTNVANAVYHLSPLKELEVTFAKRTL